MQKPTHTRAEFVRLMLAGTTGKEAAAAVGISQKTATAWKKQAPALQYPAYIARLQKSLSKLITQTEADPIAHAAAVASITDSIVKLEKGRYYATGGTPAGA